VFYRIYLSAGVYDEIFKVKDGASSRQIVTILKTTANFQSFLQNILFLAA
jgi:hypothetical protein